MVRNRPVATKPDAYRPNGRGIHRGRAMARRAEIPMCRKISAVGRALACRCKVPEPPKSPPPTRYLGPHSAHRRTCRNISGRQPSPGPHRLWCFPTRPSPAAPQQPGTATNRAGTNGTAATALDSMTRHPRHLHPPRQSAGAEPGIDLNRKTMKGAGSRTALNQFERNHPVDACPQRIPPASPRLPEGSGPAAGPSCG